MQYTRDQRLGRVQVKKRFAANALFFLTSLIVCFASWTAYGMDVPATSPPSTPAAVPTGTASASYRCDATVYAPHSPTPSLAGSVGPTSSSKQQAYDHAATTYFLLVTRRKCRLAYAILSKELQVHVPYSDFDQDENYILSSQCWSILRISYSQQESDGRAWNVGLELARRTSCNERCAIWYYWDMHLQLQRGLPVIVQIGLFPTGTDCN